MSKLVHNKRYTADEVLAIILDPGSDSELSELDEEDEQVKELEGNPIQPRIELEDPVLPKGEDYQNSDIHLEISRDDDEGNIMSDREDNISMDDEGSEEDEEEEQDESSTAIPLSPK